jgi:uncharacterized protein
MPLYGTLDGPTGNNKPKYANSTTTFGVSATEAANTLGDGPKITHAGWVQQTIGTGGISTITITSAGQGINANGFLIVVGANTTPANVAYYVSSNTNSALNVITSVVIQNPGAGYTSAPTLVFTGANTVIPVITVTAAGRAGRRFYETLVAGGSIAGDDTGDDTYFPGS